MSISLTSKTATESAITTNGVESIVIDATKVKFNLPITDASGNAFATANTLAADTGSSLVGWKQTGTGAVSRTLEDKARESVSVKDYFASSDVSSDPMFVRAINSVSASGGGIIRVPTGIYLFASEVTVPQNVEMLGDGFGSVIRPSAAIRSLFNITGGLSSIRHFNLTNISNFATHAIYCDKPADNLSVEIEHNYIAEFSNGITWASGDRPHINQNTFNSNTIAFNSIEDGRSAVVSNNYVLGGSGFSFSKTTQGAEGVAIYGNNILCGDTGAPTYAINIGAALEFNISNNIFDQVVNGVAVQIDGSVSSVDQVKFVGNWFGRQSGATGASYGVYTYGAVRGLIIQSNTFTGFRQSAIYLNGAPATVGDKAQIKGNTFYFADANIRDIQLDHNHNVSIQGNTFTGAANIVEGTNVTGRVDGCGFSLVPSVVALKYGAQLYGYNTYSAGIGACVETLKTFTANHLLDTAPQPSDFTITPTGFAVNDAGEFAVTNITTTQFTVACRNDPGAGGAPFSYSVNVAR
jgi:hypothetical protein